MCFLDHWNPINIFFYFLVLFIHSASIAFMSILGQALHILGEKQVESKLFLETPFHQKSVPLWQEARAHKIPKLMFIIPFFQAQVKSISVFIKILYIFDLSPE